MPNETLSRLERIAAAPGRATVDDTLWLVAKVEQLLLNFDEGMRQYDLQQARICEAETELEQLRDQIKQQLIEVALLQNEASRLRHQLTSRGGAVPK